MKKLKNMSMVFLAMSLMTSVVSANEITNENIQIEHQFEENENELNYSEDNGNIAIADMTIDEVKEYLEANGGEVDQKYFEDCKKIIVLQEDGYSTEEVVAKIDNSHKKERSLYSQWGSLTSSEKALTAVYPKEALVIKSNASKAQSSTNTIYGGNYNGDKTDAYRHGYWNALNARDVGKTIAEKFATAHEDVSQADLNQKTAGFYGWEHKAMDLNNNEVGRSVVNATDVFTSDSTLSTRIQDKIAKGSMVILVK